MNVVSQKIECRVSSCLSTNELNFTGTQRNTGGDKISLQQLEAESHLLPLVLEILSLKHLLVESPFLSCTGHQMVGMESFLQLISGF